MAMNFRLMAAALALTIPLIPHAAFAQGAWPEECKLMRMAGLPMTVKFNHLSIPAQVNGTDLALAIDTGGFASSLTEAAIERLGLVKHPMNSVIIRDMGGKIADEYVRAEKFRIGNLEKDGVYLSVMATLPGFDGLIAPDILRNYDVELDFGGKNFNLFKPHPCKDRAVYWAGSYAAIPITVMPDGHILVPVTLDGQDTDAIIDSGAPVSVLSMESAHRLFGLSPDSANVAAAGALMGGSGSKVNTYAYPFKTLTMGAVTVSNPRIALTEGHNFLRGNSAAVLLGMDVLSRLHLYIAYGEQKLYVTDAEAH